MSRPRTRHTFEDKLVNLVGSAKAFQLNDLPTYRAVIQRGLLIKQEHYVEHDTKKGVLKKQLIISKLAPLVIAQWKKSNDIFCPPVTITERSLVNKLIRFWTKAENVAWNRSNKKESKFVMEKLDKVIDITICPHTILLCNNPESGCPSENKCLYKAHIKCSCPREIKVPVMELRWLYGQQHKSGEKSDMMMYGVDIVESHRQTKAAKRRVTETETKMNKKKKLQQQSEAELCQDEVMCSIASASNAVKQVDDAFTPSTELMDDDLERLVTWLLKKKLGEFSHLVTQYLYTPKLKRNTMPVVYTAKASITYGVTPPLTAAIATEYLKDLIAAGILPPEMSYLACDRSKIQRARKHVMSQSRNTQHEISTKEQICGISYDGRKDKHTRAMVSDSFGNIRMRMVKEEHISVSEEPKGRYLCHFVPDEPIHPEKPAFKVAQALYETIEKHDSLDSIEFLGGDSTNSNTGWKGGSHAHLEKMLGRKLFWGICNIHTHELPLRHLIAAIDGPTSCDVGFMGEVCSLLSTVNEMPYDPHFRKFPGGEDLIHIPDEVLNNMSTDQKTCYKLVHAVKGGALPV